MAAVRGLSTLLRGPSVLSVTSKYHGLGNRVRAVLGSYTLATHEGRSFAYSWPTGPTFGASFDELWDFKQPMISPVAATLVSSLYPSRNHTLDWLNEDARRKRIWPIKTPHALQLPKDCPSWESELRMISPTSPIADRVLQTFHNRPNQASYIGVMIRTNPVAHQETARHSPLSWFLSRMADIRHVLPDVPFYVSADTDDAYRKIGQTFDLCFWLSEKGAYNSLAALSSSVVDLYMLASSSHIIGPHYSSFPELAQLLAGVDVLKLETSMSSSSTILSANTPLTTVSDPLRPHIRVKARR